MRSTFQSRWRYFQSREHDYVSMTMSAWLSLSLVMSWIQFTMILFKRFFRPLCGHSCFHHIILVDDKYFNLYYYNLHFLHFSAEKSFYSPHNANGHRSISSLILLICNDLQYSSTVIVQEKCTCTEWTGSTISYFSKIPCTTAVHTNLWLSLVTMKTMTLKKHKNPFYTFVIKNRKLFKFFSITNYSSHL